MGLIQPMPEAVGPRRTALEVAKRCLCMEMTIERIALENGDAIAPADAEGIRANTLEVASFLGLDDAFTDAERRALASSIGKLEGLESEELATLYADVPYLLWALGRIPELFSVDDLGPRLNEIIAAGLWRVEGDRHDVKRAMETATLIPNERIDATFQDIAKANGLVASAGGSTTSVPPGSVFYVWPWMQFSKWTWGVMSAMVFEHEGVKLSFGIDGVRPV